MVILLLLIRVILFTMVCYYCSSHVFNERVKLLVIVIHRSPVCYMLCSVNFCGPPSFSAARHRDMLSAKVFCFPSSCFVVRHRVHNGLLLLFITCPSSCSLASHRILLFAFVYVHHYVYLFILMDCVYRFSNIVHHLVDVLIY